MNLHSDLLLLPVESQAVLLLALFFKTFEYVLEVQAVVLHQDGVGQTVKFWGRGDQPVGLAFGDVVIFEAVKADASLEFLLDEPEEGGIHLDHFLVHLPVLEVNAVGSLVQRALSEVELSVSLLEAACLHYQIFQLSER